MISAHFYLSPEHNSAGKIPDMIEKLADVCFLQLHRSDYGNSYIACCIYLFRASRRFQHCTGHITTGSWKGRGNQYIQFVWVLYCKLPTNSKQLPAFPLEAVPGIEPRPQRWETTLCHRGPLLHAVV